MPHTTRIGRPRIEHDWSTGVERKRCGSCKNWLPVDQFGRSSRLWDGLSNKCKPCAASASTASRLKWIDKNREYDREYTRRNRAKKTAARLAWRANNLARDRANQRAWVEANRDRIREIDRARRQRNPNKRREHNARWYANNKDRAIAQVAQWRLDNPELARIKGARDRAKRRARERQLPVGTWTEQDVIDRDGLRCWINGCEVGGFESNGRRDWDIDHLIPIGVDFPDHPGDTFANVAIACNTCNRQKAAELVGGDRPV